MAKLNTTSARIIIVLLGVIVIAGFGVSVLNAGTNDWTNYAEMDWYRDQPVDPGFTIRTAEELAGIAVLVNSGEANGFKDKTIMIDNDINLSAHNWVPIGTEEHPFRGTLFANGGNIRLDGLNLYGQYRHAGFVGKAVDASIGGLTIGNTGGYHISGTVDVYAGSIVGEMEGTTEVYNVTNEMNMKVETGSSRAFVGGIAGLGEYKLSNSVNKGNVEVNGLAYAGGIIGISSVEGLRLKKVENDGVIQADGQNGSNAHAGGIIGAVQGTLDMQEEHTSIVNRGDVIVKDGQSSFAGGVLGILESSNIAYSVNTSNEGAVQINASYGIASSAGGLVGAITVPQINTVDISFVNKGNITNRGGHQVHTGGIAGLVQSEWTWSNSMSNDANISAIGIEGIYTGGLIGKTIEDMIFNGTAQNTVNGSISVAPVAEAYTGGLIGYTNKRVMLEDTTPNAYRNEASITVTGGGTRLYTGGIIANRTYSSTTGVPANVNSVGAISVSGHAQLYTGGYVGMLSSEAVDQAMEGVTFPSAITVTAAYSDPHAMVATGGIIGYYESNNVPSSLDRLAFAGILDVSGGEHVYTGGIVGYATDVKMTEAKVGNTSAAYASIASDGHAGGIAGYVSGTIADSVVSHLELNVTTQNGYAGGIAAKAQGVITSSTVGDASGNVMDSVRFAGDVTHAPQGENSVVIGGIVGENDGALHIQHPSRVNNIVLLSEAARSKYTFGGVAGVLTADAKVGADQAPVNVSNIQFPVNANSSAIGGAIGSNDSTELYVTSDTIEMEAIGNDLQVGGIIGLNKASLHMNSSKLEAVRTTLTASGDAARIGAIAGENKGTILNSTVEDGTITAAGTSNAAGGVVGINRGTLQRIDAINMTIQAQAAGASTGGIAGRSEPEEGTSTKPLIEDVQVEQRDRLLMTVSQENVHAGGIVGYALDTTIAQPVVSASTPQYVIMNTAAASTRIGGIAGTMENGVIRGDGVNTNVANLLVTTQAAAAGAYAGGVVGYSNETALDKLALKTAILTLSGTNNIAGGAAGYHLGSEDAVISNVYLDTVSMRVMPNAEGATVGGVVGLNAQRTGIDPVTNLKTAKSTLHNNRIIGNLANPDSPVIDIKAPAATAGGLVGQNNAFIANNSVSDRIAIAVTSNNSVIGGHTGVNGATGTLYYTYANANMTIGGEGTVAGGLVGSNAGRIYDSYVDTDLTGAAYGTVNALTPLGGLAGINDGVIHASYSASKVTSNGAYTIVGGLVGAHRAGSITNSYAGKDVKANATNSYAGGFAGRIVNGTIATSYSAANVTAIEGSYGGGFAGRYDNESKALLTKNYYLKDEAVGLNKDLPDFAEGNHRWLNVPARLSTLLASTLRDRDAFPTLSGWDFANVWRYGSLQAAYLYPELIRTPNSGGDDGGGSVNADVAWYTHDPLKMIYEISTEAELSGLAEIVNGTVLGVERFDFAGREIRVTNPIHIQSAEWTPIGIRETAAFKGTFNGNGHLIDGYSISAQATQVFAGLFGVIAAEGHVKNVKAEPLSIVGTDTAGALAAVNRGKVTGSEVHLADDTTISGKKVGGVLGVNRGALTGIKLTSGSEAAIEVTVDEGVAGGIVGDNERDITAQSMIDFSYQGKVTSLVPNATLGGFIGKQVGNVTGINLVAQMKVVSDGEHVIAGGVIGQYTSGDMENVQIMLPGAVVLRGQSSIAGGVIGVSSTNHIMKSVSLASTISQAAVTGNGTVGGMIGVKIGAGQNKFDLDNVEATNIAIGSFAESTHTIVGGIAGTFTNGVLHDAHFKGKLSPQGERVTIGGIAGVVSDSLLYGAEAEPEMVFTARAGESVLGGIVGTMSAADTNQAFTFGSMIPLYVGMYNAKAHTATIDASYAGTEADVVVGGLAGKNDGASLYFSESSIGLRASGFRSATVGGLVGESSGMIIQSKASGSIATGQNTSSAVGGAVGKAEGGEIHYTHVTSASGEPIAVHGTVTRLPVLPEVFAGGFAGVLNGVKITHATSDVHVKVISDNQEDSLYAGGFAGVMGDNAIVPHGAVDWAYAKGTVQIDGVTSAFAGGFAGSIDRYSITNAYAEGDVANVGFDTRSGGFAAELERGAMIQHAYALQARISAKGVNGATRAYASGFTAYSEGRMENVYAGESQIDLDVTGASAYRGALVAYLFRDGVVKDSAYAANIKAIGHELGTTTGVVQENRRDKLGVETWYLMDDASFLMRAGTDIVVTNAGQLFASVQLTNESTGLAYLQLFKRSAVDKLDTPTLLGGNIDLSGLHWRPYETFANVFDGQNHVITGLMLKDTQAANVGFMKELNGTIKNVIFTQADILAVEGAYAGIIAGKNKGVIAGIKADGKVSGGVNTGGIAGLNGTGATIDNSEASAEVTGAEAVGGIAGTNDGVITQTKAEGKASGGVNTGGIAGLNGTGATIDNSEASAEVTGAEAVGGIAGTNDGVITQTKAEGKASGGVNTGGIAGLNGTGATIDNSIAGAEVTGAEAVGGIAGTNEGDIRRSYASSIVKGMNAGGIAGDHKATAAIETVFAYGNVTATGTEANAGGIAGVTSGRIENSYASGTIKARGDQLARAGGIAGYAEAGAIMLVMGYGEAHATIDGKVSKGKSFFGGIAGQKLEAVTLTAGIFNQQMLRGNVAYYDHAGSQKAGNAANALGQTAEVLTAGVLPDEFDNQIWSQEQGFLPQLQYFNGNPAAKLSTATIWLAADERIYEMSETFQATLHNAVQWNAEAAAFTIGAHAVQGVITGESAVDLTVSSGGLSRTFTINHPRPPYERKAQVPSFVQEPKTFTEKVEIELVTEEPDGVIYYTLDGTAPGVNASIYTGPIEVSKTTTVKAITIAVDLEKSEVVTGTWSKYTSGPNIGFPVMPTPPTNKPVAVYVGDKELPLESNEPVEIVRNSKLTLTVPEGVTVYYTTDGSTPTKESKVYKGDLLIREDMTLQFMTDKDDTVISLDYKVKPISFDMKDGAAQMQYMSSYEDGSFAPDQAITRYEFIASMSRLLDIEDVPLGTLLHDVPLHQEELVARFESAGLVTGYPDGTFGGTKGLKRSEMIVILTKMLKLRAGEANEAAFVDLEGHWSNQYVSAFKEAGYIQGYLDGTFRPEREISRAETAVLINKLLGKKVSKNDDKVSAFPDLSPDHWAYDDIMAAVQ
ncbi:chitobiase/beta-hexosaminidase C-terminal domain-containing protein [Paenibacillus chungangensis]|uniref:Chitobiase/beta-hexosaminidase C-terminal domain-containing protein n=1 Tax=Paenibacillus chungangensis TaxID=696535 RepID=A0ABW3HP80_9BACL